MRTRLVPLIVALAAAPLLAAGPASAEVKGTTNCEGTSTVRFECSIKVPAGAYRTVYNSAPKCDKFRDFAASPSPTSYSGSASRRVPRSRFVLTNDDVKIVDEEHYDEETSDYADAPPMRVVAYVNSKRIKLRNTSKYAVRVSFSMRCASVNF